MNEDSVTKMARVIIANEQPPDALVELVEVDQQLRRIVRRYAWMITALVSAGLACAASSTHEVFMWPVWRSDLNLFVGCYNAVMACVCMWRAGVMTREALGIRRARGSLRLVIEELWREVAP